MTFEENNTLLYKAIEDYSFFTKNQKKLFLIMVKMAVDFELAATISDLQKASSVTRATISNAIIFFDKNGFIELLDIRGSKFSGCKLKPSKLNEIIAHYKNKKSVLENK